MTRAAVIAAAAALAVGVAAPAMAADPAVDPTKKGHLVIHKFDQPDAATGLPNDGRELTQAEIGGLTPMAGVDFKIERLTGIDLTTNAGWTALSALTPTTAASAPKATALTGTTDGSGVLDFGTGLDLGAYLVTETSAPAGVTLGAPFLVTLPTTDPTDRTKWMYDVHVYPKNSKVGTGSKTVDEGTAVKVGDEITWTILGDIPKVEEIDGYKIVDPLDSKLAHVSTKVELTDGTALTKDVDYTVVIDKHGTPEGDRVTVEFIGEGLKKLAQHNSAQVKITIVTKIVELGEIENQAVVYPNLPSFTIKPGEPGGPVVTPTPITKFGSLGIQKVSAANTSTLLAGAKFKVYPTLADAKAGTNAIKIGDIDSWTTDATGKLTISGLRYSGWYEGAPVNEGDTGYQAYWLAEVEAPNGFELLAEPVKVVVDDDDVAVEYTIENAPDNGGFTLPMTGSVLSASLFYGSGALVLAGVVLLIVRSRRKASIEA